MLSERELAIRVQRCITEVSAEEPSHTVFSARVSRGWGDIVFVRLEARQQGASDREAVEARLRNALSEALAPERSSIGVVWRQ